MKTLHDLVADKVERDPPLLRIPLENIDRWLANNHTAPHRLEQWRQIILRAQQSPESFQEMLRLLRDPSEASVHLKSFDPFPGVLSNRNTSDGITSKRPLANAKRWSREGISRACSRNWAVPELKRESKCA